MCADKKRDSMIGKIGATGQFPKGKLDASDNGELAIGIATKSGCVIINFKEPITWLGLPPLEAREFANLLLKNAAKIEKEEKEKAEKEKAEKGG